MRVGTFGEGRGIVGMGKGGWGGRLPCDCDEEKHKVSRKFVREQSSPWNPMMIFGYTDRHLQSDIQTPLPQSYDRGDEPSSREVY